MSDVGDVEQTPAAVDESARQRVENQLLDAYAQGRLTDDEFDRRIRSAVEATSAEDLQAATRDIPAAGTRTDDPTVDPATTASTTASAASPATADTSPSTTSPITAGGGLTANSPASATGPGSNPLSLDTEPPDFPAYPYGQQTGPSPYGQSGPYVADPAPRAQSSPYGPYGDPAAQQTGGAQVAPYGEKVPGRGYPVPAGLGKAGASKATGALAHFLGLFTWIIGPGIIFAVSPAGSDARKEAAKSFNFQVVAMLTLIVGGIISAVILPNWMDNILLPLIWLGWLLGTVVGGAKAAQGEDWTNPATKVTRLRILSEK